MVKDCNDCPDQYTYDDINDVLYVEEVFDGYTIRTFSSDCHPISLKWHFDDEDRIVIPLHDSDWKFQFNDELPIDLTKDNGIFIGKGQYHRVIKGSGNLSVKIIKM
jgi:hypothetical protein